MRENSTTRKCLTQSCWKLQILHYSAHREMRTKSGWSSWIQQHRWSLEAYRKTTERKNSEERCGEILGHQLEGGWQVWGPWNHLEGALLPCERHSETHVCPRNWEEAHKNHTSTHDENFTWGGSRNILLSIISKNTPNTFQPPNHLIFNFGWPAQNSWKLQILVA